MSSDKSIVTPNEKRVLVISGGGARGAWGGGVLKALHEQENPNYRCIVGNSTGSLLAPLVAIEDYGLMEKCFTKVAMEDIFNVNPFDKKGEIRLWNAIKRILRGKENLGESTNLRKTITRFFGPDEYKKLKDTGRIVKATVVSLTSNAVQYKSSEENEYDNMMDWVWASANQPVFMTAVDKFNEKWVDGGIKDNVPIEEGIKYACAHNIKVIDVVINNTLAEKRECWPAGNHKTNVIPKLLRIINIFSDEVLVSDIKIGVLLAEAENMDIYLYHMKDDEFNLCPKSLLFKKEV